MVRSIISLITILILVGCSINPEHVQTMVNDVNQIKAGNTVYVAVNRRDNGRWVGIASEIKSEFEKRGFKASFGELIDKPEDTDFYVMYKVGWGVDFLVVYIRSLDIRIYSRENKLIAEGDYNDKNFLHRIPASADIVKIIINDIFAKK